VRLLGPRSLATRTQRPGDVRNRLRHGMRTGSRARFPAHKRNLGRVSRVTIAEGKLRQGSRHRHILNQCAQQGPEIEGQAPLGAEPEMGRVQNESLSTKSNKKTDSDPAQTQKAKTNSTIKIPKLIFPLKSRKFTTVPWRSPPPPLFDWKLKMCSSLTSTLQMKNEIWEVARSPIHSRVLYIGPNKRLNDYYAPVA
jgi:hypothetical protein